MMEPATYCETRRFLWAWACWLLAIVCAICAVVFAVSQPERNTETMVVISVLAATTLLFGFTGTAFARYFIEVGNGVLRFGYSFWNAELLLSDIESTTAEQLTFTTWWGQGWRIDKHKRIGYIAQFGDGVEVKLRSGRAYVLSCRDPQSLVAAIHAAG